RPRADPVGRDEHVAHGSGAVREVRADLTLVPQLVSVELLAEVDASVEAGQENLTQGQAVHRRADGRERLVAGPGKRPPAGLVEPAIGDAEDAESPARLAARGEEELIQSRRQAGAQRLFPAGVDVHAVALRAGRQGAIALVNFDLDPGLAQPLGQTETAQAGPNHQPPPDPRRPGQANVSSRLHWLLHLHQSRIPAPATSAEGSAKPFSRDPSAAAGFARA